jgi:hypothetical protein
MQVLAVGRIDVLPLEAALDALMVGLGFGENTGISVSAPEWLPSWMDFAAPREHNESPGGSPRGPILDRMLNWRAPPGIRVPVSHFSVSRQSPLRPGSLVVSPRWVALVSGVWCPLRSYAFLLNLTNACVSVLGGSRPRLRHSRHPPIPRYRPDTREAANAGWRQLAWPGTHWLLLLAPRPKPPALGQGQDRLEAWRLRLLAIGG